MDIQLKKGLLEICVLIVLKKNDSYGYQIIKDVSNYIELSESTLYPILKRLEANSYVTTYSVEHNSRLRKYYKITEEGKEKISEFLIGWKDVMRVYDFIEGVDRDDYRIASTTQVGDNNLEIKHTGNKELEVNTQYGDVNINFVGN